MKIEHSYTFKSIPREVLWRTIQDKEVLKRTLPGCKSFVEVEDNVFESELGISIGPVKGIFTGDVRQVDRKEPEFYRLLVTGKGKPGEIDADAEMVLLETEEGTVLQCLADVKLTGILASVGQRVMSGIAKVVIGQFFKEIDKEAKQLV
ncbi:carbon monoxide dehydrogenase subunit G [Bacillus sp. FJAT-49705]|uniref:Carbon monoxide dehydrogenase subunit G n=1 Tax=Cytobacillus citreus TaxID=2833586 RepID=A0ABS5NRQ3_9BACI|nr:carbon monoxide dehydrogenase subunit G [Cytobacillus citreus]MBS4190497.1 carbon monoxide dehydrogenase subunit G [Cytobacillus citreus]